MFNFSSINTPHQYLGFPPINMPIVLTTAWDPLSRKFGTKDFLDFTPLSQKIIAYVNSKIKTFINICFA
jgi:hypothetical protein